MTTMTTSWSDLSSDLLLLISEALTIADFTSFSSVCRSWRSLASSVKRHRRCRRQEPLLLFAGGEDPSAANLYSISDQKIFTIPNQPDPPIANRICLGSANGWLITADERSELSLLNPITRQQFDLPPVTTFDHIVPLRRDPDGQITDYGLEKEGDILDYSAESLRYFLYVKAALSSSPSIDDDYMVVLLLYQPDYLAFARSGDEKWTVIGPECPRYDIMYHNNEGKVYTILWRSGEVESWDFSQKDGSLPEPTVFVPKPEMKDPELFHFCYLVHTPWEELLHVRRVRSYTMEDYLLTRSIEVHRVDSKTGKMVQIKSLGDYTLFLGGNHPICISSKDVAGLKGNCIYFNDEFLEHTYGFRNCQRDIGIFNLEDESIEPILPDDSRLDRPLPFWLMPSLV